jgi:archaemetzincin
MLNRRDFVRTTLAVTAGGALLDTSAAQQPGTVKQLPPKQVPAKQPAAAMRFSVEEAKRTIKLLEPLHEHKKPAQPGDWLASEARQKEERGQTFDEYLRGRKRTIEQYTKLYLLPLGTFSDVEQKMIAAVVAGMTYFFGLPATQLKADPLAQLPAHAERINNLSGKRQLLSIHLLDKVLPAKRPKDAAALLGLTNVDLWPGEGWNFVFGQASLGTRVGVWSTARYGDSAGTEEERKLFFKRLLKVALHETGHMFGIPHCTAYECGMNGSNSLPESDRQAFEFCPECQAKLWWTNDYTPRKRAAALLEFCKQNGLEDEALYYTGLSAVL